MLGASTSSPTVPASAPAASPVGSVFTCTGGVKTVVGAETIHTFTAPGVFAAAAGPSGMVTFIITRSGGLPDMTGGGLMVGGYSYTIPIGQFGYTSCVVRYLTIQPTIPPFGAGGVVTTEGPHTVHTFTTSGTFIPPAGITSVRYRVIGGGLSSGIYEGIASVTGNNYAVLVGDEAGGASSFASIVAPGGAAATGRNGSVTIRYLTNGSGLGALFNPVVNTTGTYIDTLITPTPDTWLFGRRTYLWNGVSGTITFGVPCTVEVLTEWDGGYEHYIGDVLAQTYIVNPLGFYYYISVLPNDGATSFTSSVALGPIPQTYP
jgi:hypothetical protein